MLANGECVTEIKVEVASGVLTPCNTFCQSDDALSGRRRHAMDDGGGVLASSSIILRFFLFGDGMYIFNVFCKYIYMNNLPDEIIRLVCDFLKVKDVLNFEVGICRPSVNNKQLLVKRYNREPKFKEVIVQKKNRKIKYILNSYYDNNNLFTKVTSWYGTHKIISIVSHEICRSTVEANAWTLSAFTLHKTYLKKIKKMQFQLQLHF